MDDYEAKEELDAREKTTDEQEQMIEHVGDTMEELQLALLEVVQDRSDLKKKLSEKDEVIRGLRAMCGALSQRQEALEDALEEAQARLKRPAPPPGPSLGGET